MSDLISLSGLLKKLPEARVLCIGDIMLDSYIYGSAERLSPEAPIPVLKKTREKEVLGGVGNVVAGLAALGAKTRLVSLRGDDEAGLAVMRLLEKFEVESSGVVIDRMRPTTIKMRFVAGQQQLLRVDHEETRAVSPDISTLLKAAVAQALDDCDVVVISDYAKGVLSRELVRDVIVLAKRAGKLVIVDPKIKDFSFYSGADLITPNRKELEEATGMSAVNDDEVRAAALKIIHECDIAAVLVTRSQDGMSVITAGMAPVHIRAAAREVFDVSGAGDTVVATIAASLATGAPLATAAALATVSSGIVVGKHGTATVTPDEIEAELSAVPSNAATLAQVQEQIERWRARGLKIGFTNGCFDLLHPGHISLLKQARAQCDRLIVGLNTDNSVKRLKGPARPVQSENARATVLNALGTVDLVVLFDEETPINLIKSISPDILVKGSDYTVDKVVGADHVQSYGGRVFLANLEDGFSTTATVKKISG